MAVHCSTCQQPWEAYHLLHDSIFQTRLNQKEAEAWSSLPRAQKLSDRYRNEFRSAGWEFGRSVINVVRCCYCPKDAKPDPLRLKTKAALERLMDDDEEALAALFEAYRL